MVNDWRFQVATILLATFGMGHTLSYIKSIKLSRTLAWSLLLLSVATTYLICVNKASPFWQMLFIIFSLLLSIKAIVYIETIHNGKSKLPLLTRLCFTLGWLGMRPYVFNTLGQKALPGARELLRKGLVNVMAGSILILLGRYINTQSLLATSIVFLLGLSLILHFGLIPIQAGFWRLFGVNTQLLFREPYKSRSLGEFWSHRWNLAFSEMTTIAIYRPLKKKLNANGAKWVAFIMSGIFHELAISLPVNKGYGLPLTFFIFQAIGISLEEKTWFNTMPTMARRIWTFLWLIVPAPLLFHIHFIKDLVLPTLLP